MIHCGFLVFACCLLNGAVQMGNDRGLEGWILSLPIQAERSQSLSLEVLKHLLLLLLLLLLFFLISFFLSWCLLSIAVQCLLLTSSVRTRVTVLHYTTLKSVVSFFLSFFLSSVVWHSNRRSLARKCFTRDSEGDTQVFPFLSFLLLYCVSLSLSVSFVCWRLKERVSLNVTKWPLVGYSDDCSLWHFLSLANNK